MPDPVRDSVIVVTGASSGIGRATAHRLAREGARLVLAARRTDALEDAARECRELGAEAVAVPTDVAREEDVAALARRAEEAFGRIDVWVNDAAVTLFGRIDEVPMADFERVIRTNLLGYVHGAREAVRRFRRQQNGTLIQVASVVAHVGQPFTTAYVASKWAILGLSESLRMELDNLPEVHVSTVLPGSTDTPLFQNGANYSGRAVRPIPPVDPPERVADTILDAIRRPRREVYVRPAMTAVRWAHALAPGAVEPMMSRQVRRKHFQDAPAPPFGGNLFDPGVRPAAVHGGWGHEDGGGGRARRPAALAAGLALAAVPAALYVWRRARA